MKVFVTPPSTLSQAMFRVARALRRYAPSWVTVVQNRSEADLEVLHVIGVEAISYPKDNIVVIQYCKGGELEPDSIWCPLWKRAKMVWSYYDLRPVLPWGANFYHAPLGVDHSFSSFHLNGDVRDIGIMTSGYVTGPGAEAIDEVATAAHQLGQRVIHVGPHNVQNMPYRPPRWHSVRGIPDNELADLYAHSKWVSGLRFVEGFEMPVIEGLACGARPIVFERPDMAQWYRDHAVFVPECHGPELVERLVDVLQTDPKPVSAAERIDVTRKFGWKTIVERFWTQLEGAVR